MRKRDAKGKSAEREAGIDLRATKIQRDGRLCVNKKVAEK
jgi:hypothetical protein